MEYPAAALPAPKLESMIAIVKLLFVTFREDEISVIQKMSSRWAASADEQQELENQRKKQKEQKRQQKQERERKAAQHAAIQQQQQEDQHRSKRQRIASPAIEGAHALEFVAGTFGPCRSLDEYVILNNIEEGSYGFVSRAKTKSSGEVVALKRLKRDSKEEGFPVTGLREIQTLRACSHNHIVGLREVVVGPDPVQE